ncbi:hypothetical protein MMC07_005211 [Pseudocyphellaria aurata]|nr:hypothetical protein [Pseudocyphellaria aurata]
MTWLSILPAHLTVVETWITRFFLLLGIVLILPGLLLIVYDLVLYLVRAIAYEVPYFGGRARGRQRPRAPSLAERPNGRARTFSIGGPVMSGSDSEGREGMRWRPHDARIQANIDAVVEE